MIKSIFKIFDKYRRIIVWQLLFRIAPTPKFFAFVQRATHI